MSEERWYRDALIRRRYRDRQPHGWWLMREGPLAVHPDKGWVPTLEHARAEIDGHILRGGCLLRDGSGWRGVLAVGTTVDSLFDRGILRGFSGWCAVRHDQLHEPCSTKGCPCDCHGAVPRG